MSIAVGAKAEHKQPWQREEVCGIIKLCCPLLDWFPKTRQEQTNWLVVQEAVVVRPATEQADADLDALMQRYALRIVGRERVASGPASWGATRLGPSGQSVYDPGAYWQKTHYTVHRELACERCGFR
jgi:hypothetical protein